MLENTLHPSTQFSILGRYLHCCACKRFSPLRLQVFLSLHVLGFDLTSVGPIFCNPTALAITKKIKIIKIEYSLN